MICPRCFSLAVSGNIFGGRDIGRNSQWHISSPLLECKMPCERSGFVLAAVWVGPTKKDFLRIHWSNQGRKSSKTRTVNWVCVFYISTTWISTQESTTIATCKKLSHCPYASNPFRHPYRHPKPKTNTNHKKSFSVHPGRVGMMFVGAKLCSHAPELSHCYGMNGYENKFCLVWPPLGSYIHWFPKPRGTETFLILLNKDSDAHHCAILLQHS